MADKPLIKVKLDSSAVDKMLKRVETLTGNLAPLMVSIRQELLTQTEANFEAGGRPRWPALAASTIKQREQRRKWPGQILQVSGTLARSLVTESDERSAMVGVGAEVRHAAIHQLGGQAGRGRKTTIPARPYLPLVNARLQPEAEAAILKAQGGAGRKVNPLGRSSGVLRRIWVACGTGIPEGGGRAVINVYKRLFGAFCPGDSISRCPVCVNGRFFGVWAVCLPAAENL